MFLKTADVMQYAGITDQNKVNLVDVLILAVQAMFEKYLSIDLEENEATEYYDGDGEERLYLNRTPIISVASLYDDSDHSWGAGTEITSENFVISADADHIFLKSGTFYEYVKNIKVTYTAGYGGSGGSSIALPNDLKLAGLEQTAYEFKRADQGLVGVSARGTEQSSTNFVLPDQDTGLLRSVKAKITRYRRRVVA